MISLIVTALTALAAGFILRGADRRRSRYGAFLLPGISLAVAMVMWVGLQLSGIGSDPDLYWLIWVMPPVAGGVSALVTARALAPRREAQDTAALEGALRL